MTRAMHSNLFADSHGRACGTMTPGPDGGTKLILDANPMNRVIEAFQWIWAENQAFIRSDHCGGVQVVSGLR